MVKLSDATESLAVAAGLAKQGLQVFPARYKDKAPIVDWKKFQSTSAAPMLEKWFKNRGYLNFWVMTGRQSGYVVIDIDSAAGDDWWRERLGSKILDSTAQVATSKGVHYWFSLEGVPAEAVLKSWSVHPREEDGHDISFDVRMDGTGVIVPPSVHETGVRYEWRRTLDKALPCPPGLYDGSIKSQAPVSTGDAGGGMRGAGGETRSMLSRLLANPPGGDGSGRNDWLARVAGHYAKTYHNQQDLYAAHCRAANSMMGAPLDEDEFTKTMNSIWQGEHENNVYRSMDMSSGFLTSGGNKIMTQVIVKRGDSKDYDIVEYSDFDLTAKGVMTDEAGSRTYWCEVVRKKRDGSGESERFDIVLKGDVLGDDRSLRKFLARFACTIVPPENMWPRAGTPGQRIQRYLESQRPPVVEIADCLGFHASAISDGVGGFVTHEGAITADGAVGIDGVSVRADPRLRSGGTAPFEYGFADNEVVARQILAEVLTFHDEQTATVFGSWWAACQLKPQIETETSLFPFMAIEAPSESGKTNGFFAMMNQMNGNTRGETQPTKAALRDMAAANRNGIVWVDDLDDPAYLMELLRAATSGGSLTKMGEDRESVKNTAIVAPVVISGEALGLGTQKALIDRAILLKAPSPTSRKSFRDPTRPQWDDILDLRRDYPEGLHALAGWYVKDALAVQEETLRAVREGRTGGQGRAADKVAVLRAGARLLDWLLSQDEAAWEGGGEHAVRLETWLRLHLLDSQGNATLSTENTLTLEIIPWALQNWKNPDKAMAGEVGRIDFPVFVRVGEATLLDEPEVWFNTSLLALAWEDHKRGQQEKRTTTAAALKDQADALNCKSKQWKITNGGGRRASYRQLPAELAKIVLIRSQGDQ